MRKITINVITLNIFFVIGATAISTILFLAEIRDESERLAKVEQEQGIQTFWRLLKAKGNDFKIVNGRLMAGDYVLNGNFELPDMIQSIFGGTATVFMGDTRVSTNILKGDGTRAVGTKLNGPAYNAIFRHNQPYRGEAMILGIPYFTAYDPIRNSRGEIIGVLYVGAKKNEFYSRYEHYKANVIAGAAVISTIFAVLAVVILRDRKLHVEALEENETKYRTLFESSAEGILLFDHIIFDCNEQLCRLLGRSRDKIIGRSPLHFSPDLQPDGTPSADKARQLIDAALAGEARFFPWQHQRQDGTLVDAEVSLKALTIQGRTVLQAVVRDVTEREKAERLLTGEKFALELVNSEASLDKVLEFLCRLMEEQARELRCSILLVDADGRHLRHGAAPSLPAEYNRIIDGTRIGPNIGTCGTAAFSGSLVVTGDIETDPRWVKYRKLPLSHGLRACWSMPVKARNGAILGTFAAYSTVPREPAAAELQLMERLGHLTSIAIERKQAEESLRMIRLQQQAILDNIPDLVWLKDIESRFIAVNAAFAKACGTTPSELVGTNDLDLWPTDLATLYREDDARVMASGKQIRTEEPLVDINGKRVWIETIKMPIYDEAGAVIGTTGIARDISERRETELKLRENETRLAKAQQIAHVGNWDWDILNNTLHWSDEIFRIFRIPPDQPNMTYETFLEAVHPDDRQNMTDAMQASLHDKVPYGITYRIICPDGEIRHLRTEGEVEFDTEGAPVRMQGVVKDITVSTLAEEALRESEARFREIFEQNEDAIILLSRETLDIIDANKAAETLIGRDKESLNWLGPWSFIVPDDYNPFIGAIPHAEDTTPFHLDRIGVVRSDGTRLISSIWGKIIRLRDTEVVYCSIRDITQRIRMEEEAQITQSRLIHTNKMASLGVLVSGIAHEINNPNTFIQGNASLIESFWRDTVPILDRHHTENGDFVLGGLPFVEVEKIFPRLLLGVKEGSRRISAIVNNLKDFAREDTAKTFVPIAVNNIVENAKMILSYQIHRYTDHFRMELGEDLPQARGKFQQIEQVVINLIMNALQALPGKDAGVTVSTSADLVASVVTISVRDEGEGMPWEVLERITEPFFSTKLEQGGTGLGLSISAAIIREHDGTLTFESTPGKGTTATVTLPLAYPVGERNHA
ncbi:PAS domain S-box protein [Geobacter hydrogenophilus]|uniref:histidine kinase n=1 Tax=Geobacter hydrogenophilus TaxID=40983 RepID=A0A9W6FXY6_9BACT|nr:PAS domain S-box protein [Geobacter hydrogenophilus]GLI36951.1 hypothetical protein GHYDROH2_04520 [Geobacter hydrogenophilus]